MFFGVVGVYGLIMLCWALTWCFRLLVPYTWCLALPSAWWKILCRDRLAECGFAGFCLG